jgi:hypothetical protein
VENTYAISKVLLIFNDRNGRMPSMEHPGDLPRKAN